MGCAMSGPVAAEHDGAVIAWNRLAAFKAALQRINLMRVAIAPASIRLEHAVDIARQALQRVDARPEALNDQ